VLHRVFLFPAFLVVAALAAACASTSLPVVSDYDPQADFSKYSSYAWIEQPVQPPEGQQLPEHLDRRLHRVIEDVLDAKGLQRAPALPQADLLLTTYVSLNTEVRVIRMPNSPYGYAYGYWPGWTYTPDDVRSYHKGTVVLDIVDRKTNQLVWTGAVTSAVNNPNPPSDRIQKVIEALLAGFPPKKAG
jgi:hypothetical protein